MSDKLFALVKLELQIEMLTRIGSSGRRLFRRFTNSQHNSPTEGDNMNLRKLCIASSLTLFLCVAAFAGETNAPPCAVPGETNAPPCATAPTIDASLDAGGPTSPPAPSVGDAISIGEIAADLLQSALSLL